MFSNTITPPGYRVWHSLLYMYNLRGAWKQSLAILRYLQSLESASSSSSQQQGSHPIIYANNFIYHYIISTLSQSTSINSYSYALNFYQEMKERNITPHPLTLSVIIKSLSSWSRDGVAYVDTMIQISNLICLTCIDLTQLSDEQFIDLYVTNHTKEIDYMNHDPYSFSFYHCKEQYNRLNVINKLIIQLMISLSCDRGLNIYAHELMNHLTLNGVIIPNEAIEALIQVNNLYFHQYLFSFFSQ